jgi:hypothetical protein
MFKVGDRVVIEDPIGKWARVLKGEIGKISWASENRELVIVKLDTKNIYYNDKFAAFYKELRKIGCPNNRKTT